MSTSKLSILCLTDPIRHNSVESTYPLLRELNALPEVGKVMVVSRSEPGNKAFFYQYEAGLLQAKAVDEDFRVENKETWFGEGGEAVAIAEFDFVLLRLPRPNPVPFYEFLLSQVPGERLINHPHGILEAGNKEFLLHFPGLTPETRMLRSVDEVREFAAKFPIVLKPLESSGGRGLIRMDGQKVWDEQVEMGFDEFLPELKDRIGQGILGMEYLPEVRQGDKRVIVANGEIVGASVRIPESGSWLANAAQGATAHKSAADEAENAILNGIWPEMKKRGVVFFGFDTLVGKSGKRVLSEINASCVNGLLPAQQLSGEPVLARTARALVNHMSAKTQQQYGKGH